MVLEQDIKKMFAELIQQELAQVAIGGSTVVLRLHDSASKLSLSTDVYYGGNYIPKSVRHSIKRKPSFEKDAGVKTFLTVDDKRFQIFLNYLGTIETMTPRRFIELLEEFAWLADEWRLYLDEHDQNDRIYIHAS